MITNFADYSQNSSQELTLEQKALINEYLESFTPKICCFEGYWSKVMTDPLSVKPFLKAIGWMIEKEIVVAHRYIDNPKSLSYYTHYPEGIIWQDPYLAGIDVFYLAAHGKIGGLKTLVTPTESEDLFTAFNGLDQYNNIVYFSGCGVLAGEKGALFAKEFLRRTGTVAVVGYAEMTTWIDSLVIDTLFLSRFFDGDGNPYSQLQKIYDSILRDYPKSMECGFSLFLNEKDKSTFKHKLTTSEKDL